jgi:hypothetical protein
LEAVRLMNAEAIEAGEDISRFDIFRTINLLIKQLVLGIKFILLLYIFILPHCRRFLTTGLVIFYFAEVITEAEKLFQNFLSK